MRVRLQVLRYCDRRRKLPLESGSFVRILDFSENNMAISKHRFSLLSNSRLDKYDLQLTARKWTVNAVGRLTPDQRLDCRPN